MESQPTRVFFPVYFAGRSRPIRCGRWIDNEVVKVNSMTVVRWLSIFTATAASAWCAGPVLTSDQIQAAIQEGSQYKNVDEYYTKGLKGKRITLATAMALDGIGKYATFFNDWQAVAAEAAAAKQQMRELKPADIQSSGLLHAFVEVQARGIIPSRNLNRRYADQRAHLVLKIGQRIIQPVDKRMISKDEFLSKLFGAPSEKITLNFAFDVSPDDLKSPVTVILIDGDGDKHQAKTDLDGILAAP